ncbi:small-conductance mechanosensitive channel [Conyzicola nivalis]|uniref:Small-conductance mechanosensitive channel n=1 Tax=Conyzicola nivalis TaxID=1477021 RepID=A0ABV2QS52_9MICO
MFDWHSWLGLAVAVAIALVAALAVAVVTKLIVLAATKRREWPRALTTKARHPYRLLLVVIAVWVAISLTIPGMAWVNHLFLILLIAVGAWFVGAIVGFAIELGMGRYRIDVPDNRVARRIQTQLAIVRRLAYAVIVIVAAGSILLTFPGVQAVGASVLASAGIVSIVAGLAAQSTLANVFAGVQLAFSDAIRVDDVVIAEGEWGRIEEITLTYVVVHIWDDRRMVLPSTYFTSTPFENWTRSSSELLGSIEIDLDWRVSPAAMRVELEKILARTTIWDGRASVLQVTDATAGFVRVRILVTAVDAPTLFDLRCFVREEMVEWLQAQDPGAIPRTRVQMVEELPRKKGVVAEKTHTDQVGLFTGSPEAEERATQLTSAIPVIDDASAARDRELRLR